MAPKRASTTGTKKAKPASHHGSYQDMIAEAIVQLKDRSGSSRQALKKYVMANNNLDGVTDAQFASQFNRALQRGSDSGLFDRPKGVSGPVKLAGPKTAKDSTTKTATTTRAPAKAKTTKADATNTSPAKAATKKTTATKKARAKKPTTTKSKANTSTKRTKKAPAMAPAVEESPAVTLGKTKSGRVTKSTQPQPPKKAITTKRKAPAKKATPKKTATAQG